MLRARLGTGLRAVWLHGSAVTGGLRPASDVDLLAITDHALGPGERSALIAGLLVLSGRYPHAAGAPRPIELLVFTRDDLAPPPFPARADLVYGEWLRAELETGTGSGPDADPEYTLLLAQARQEARPLFGPGPAGLLSEIPARDIRRAIAAALPRLIEGLATDTRNTLLTLARMWHTLETGAFVPKDVAAERVAAHLTPQAGKILAAAAAAYRCQAPAAIPLPPAAIRRAAEELRAGISARLGGG